MTTLSVPKVEQTEKTFNEIQEVLNLYPDTSEIFAKVNENKELLKERFVSNVELGYIKKFIELCYGYIMDFSNGYSFCEYNTVADNLIMISITNISLDWYKEFFKLDNCVISAALLMLMEKGYRFGIDNTINKLFILIPEVNNTVAVFVELENDMVIDATDDANKFINKVKSLINKL